MLCAKCKRKFPKWKKYKSIAELCKSCKHQQMRQKQIDRGERPTAVPKQSEKNSLLLWLEGKS